MYVGRDIYSIIIKVVCISYIISKYTKSFMYTVNFLLFHEEFHVYRK